jgi:thiamine biosynthesis lipoprotein
MNRRWLRRARPLLGTLVEVGVPHGCDAAISRAFDVIEQVQALMSAHDARSDLGRLHAMPAEQACEVHPWTAEVLSLAADLHARTLGCFDVAQGSGAWSCQHEAGAWCVVRQQAACRLDLGGIAKGWAVDRAVDAVRALGVDAVWVNAGGDLRCEGVSLPVVLREESEGGVRPWLTLRDGAVATSWYAPGSRSALHGCVRRPHVSVTAPRCAIADALTKVAAQVVGEPPWWRTLLVRHGAQVWRHARTMSTLCGTTNNEM